MPVHSMTGYGQAQGPLSAGRLATVQVSSVNSRFLEVHLRTQPRWELGGLEAAVRGVVAQRLRRGRVTLTLTVEETSPATACRWRWEVVEALQVQLRRLPAGVALAPLSLRDLFAIPGFLDEGGRALAEGEEEALLRLVEEACAALLRAREAEGAALATALALELEALEEFATWLREANAALRGTLLERLRARLAEVVPAGLVPEERLLAEAALAADRADVAEEVERIEAHLRLARRLLAGGGAVGKELEFVLQELLREVNTAAAKGREAGLGERVVAAKAALERCREQVANLE